jgi:hypothetical protein
MEAAAAALAQSADGEEMTTTPAGAACATITAPSQGQSSSDASPAERLPSADRRSEALAKLKSVVVMPQRHYDAEHAGHALNGRPG